MGAGEAYEGMRLNLFSFGSLRSNCTPLLMAESEDICANIGVLQHVMGAGQRVMG